MTKSIGYRDDIQVLRGVAVLAVLLFHVNAQFFPLGFLGVDIFFVVSGFVVTPMIIRIYAKNNDFKPVTPKVLNFYLRRFYRLAPALGSLFIFSSILIFLFGPVQDHQRFARQGIATLLLIGNLGAHRYAGDYFSPNPNPLIHTWSLSVEEQFYLTLPLLLLLFIRIKRNIEKISISLFFFITLFSGSFFFFENFLEPIYSHFGFTQDAQLMFYSPISRAWEFAIGGLVYFYVNRSIPRNVSKYLNISIVCLLIILLFLPQFLNLKIYSLLAVVISATSILYISLNVLPIPIRLPLIWLGDRSYSIYLWHLPVIYLIHFSPFLIIAHRMNSLLLFFLTISVCLFLGSVSYALIEKGFRYKVGYRWFFVTAFISVILPFFIFLSMDRSAVQSSLDPNLPKPSAISPWNWDKNCQFFSPQPDINYKPCFYGSKKSVGSILLIGDSHAAADSLPIIELARTKNLNTYVFTFSACSFILTPIDDTSPFDFPQLTSECIEHNREIVNIVRTKKPIAIIWAHRSSSIMVIPNNKESRLFFNQTLMSNVSKLKQLGVPIIHIGSEPELVPITTWMERFAGKEAVFSRVPFEDNLFWKQKDKTEHYIDTVSIFCPQGFCTNKSNAGWLFEDTNHLSNLGMKRVIPEVATRLDKILLGSSPSRLDDQK